MGVRRLRVLVEQLPAESGLVRAETKGWTTADELAALQAELLDVVQRAVRAAGGDKTAAKAKPLKVPRPGDGEKKKVGWAGLARRLMRGGG